MSRKEIKDKGKGGKGDSRVCWFVAKQGILQHDVEREATHSCPPLMKTRAKPLKKRLTVMKSCKRGVGWKKANMSSGKR